MSIYRWNGGTGTKVAFFCKVEIEDLYLVPSLLLKGNGGHWDYGGRTLRASAVGGGLGGPGGHLGTSPPPSSRWAPALYYLAAQGGIQGGPGGAIGAPAGVIVPLDGAALGHIVGFAPKLTSPAFQRGL